MSSAQSSVGQLISLSPNQVHPASARAVAFVKKEKKKKKKNTKEGGVSHIKVLHAKYKQKTK